MVKINTESIKEFVTGEEERVASLWVDTFVLRKASIRRLKEHIKKKYNPVLRKDGIKVRMHLAVFDSQVIGQNGAFITHVNLGKKQITLAWMIDAVTLPAFRGKGVFSQLLKKTVEKLKKDKVRLILGFPKKTTLKPIIEKKKWLPIKSVFNFVNVLNVRNAVNRSSLFPEWLPKYKQLQFTKKTFFHDEKCLKNNKRFLTIKMTNRINSDFNDLWNSVSGKFSLICKRDKKFLNWRYKNWPNNKYFIFTAYRENKLKGYLIASIKNQDGFLVDLLCDPSDEFLIMRLISHCLQFFKTKNISAVFSVMSNRYFKKALTQMNFIPYQRLDLFMLLDTDTSSNKEILGKINDWFITLGDSDLEME